MARHKPRITSDETTIEALTKKIEAAKKTKMDEIHKQIIEILGTEYQIIPVIQIGDAVIPATQVINFPSGWTVGAK